MKLAKIRDRQDIIGLSDDISEVFYGKRETSFRKSFDDGIGRFLPGGGIRKTVFLKLLEFFGEQRIRFEVLFGDQGMIGKRRMFGSEIKVGDDSALKKGENSAMREAIRRTGRKSKREFEDQIGATAKERADAALAVNDRWDPALNELAAHDHDDRSLIRKLLTDLLKQTQMPVMQGIVFGNDSRDPHFFPPNKWYNK